ncbi:MAG: DUF4382 domain-containing protein [Thaumarchaeota archaeon]|nr:DUF4382 domain-containing protein [Nitrososphaerota archaeon]
MSVKRNTIRYGAAAAVLALAIIATSSFLAGSSVLPSSSSSSIQGPKSLLVIQLTDPPHVPVGTLWLNMTYSSLDFLVGEPTGVDNQVTPKTITNSTSATLDLLRLQNISQTIGSISLPDGSVIYSVTFHVSGIVIDINGTKPYPSVSLASGTSFTVAVAGNHQLHGTNKVLLQLNPVVVYTGSVYNMIPSSVGVLRQSEGAGESQIGWEHRLTSSDTKDLDSAQGNLSANLLTLSVVTSTSSTTLTVQVNNTGSQSITLNAIGVSGNFTAQGNSCPWSESSTTTTTTLHTESPQVTDNSAKDQPRCWPNFFLHVVAFVPVIPPTSAQTSTSCALGQLSLVTDDLIGEHQDGGLVLAPGECINLTYVGIIKLGGLPVVLTPSTAPGQPYGVHIFASNGANLQLDCVLPTGANSCKVDQHP